MSENWHGYFLVERHTVGQGNWDALIALFEAMGTHGTMWPMHNMHWRPRMDGNAVIYESLFSPSEVGVDSFKQLLASEFGVDVNDIDHTVSQISYKGVDQTTVWTFQYAGVDRFSVHRFGQGGGWEQSRQEALAYIAQNLEEWQEIVD